MEKQIKIAKRLYEIRDTTKNYLGEKVYSERIGTYREIVSAVMAKHAVSASEAILVLDKEGAYTSDLTKMMFISAATEIMMEG